MAASLTYTTLVSDIIGYCERSSDTVFVAQVPRIIMVAENRIASECKGLGYVQYVTSQMTQGNPVLQKPTRWRESASFRLMIAGATKPYFLKSRLIDYCKAYWPDPTQLLIPKYYADYGFERFFLAPTPDLSYNFELAYYERPMPLDDTNLVNWTTQYAPQLLLYACLWEANMFLKNTQKCQEWQALYNQAKSDLELEAKMRLSDRASMSRSSE